MPQISSAWSVRKSGTDYTTTADGSQMTFRSINPSDALMIIENSDSSYNTTFSTEDEVTLKIGSTNMMVGYIAKIENEWSPNRQKNLKLHIVDWGSYLAGKTVYENNYRRSTSASTVFSNAASQISSLTTNITSGLTADAFKLKREFAGTYVKDHWYAASEVAGADFFVDENKVLHVWPHGSTSRDLLASNSVRYKIQDTASAAANQLMVRMDKQISYSDDATNRFRTVVATNGIYESFPTNIDLMTDPGGLFHDDVYGKNYPYNFDIFGVPSDWAISSTTLNPIEMQPNASLTTGFNAPVARCIIKNTSMSATLLIHSQDINFNILNWNLQVTDWQKVAFYMKNSLTGGSAVDSIFLFLIDDIATINKYWVRDIYNDVNVDTNGDGVADSRTSWTYLEYDLPADTSSSTTNGWTKGGSPNKINGIGLVFYHGGSTTGYAASSYVEFAKMHFWRKQRYTSSVGSGTPATKKIIVDASAKNLKNLTNLAVTEQARVNVIAQPVECTISGNTNFRKPGYNIDFDFTTIFGTGKSKTRARIDEITHRLENGMHYTDLILNDAYQRP